MNKNYENVKKWREENKEKFKEQRKRYYEKNKEKINGRINEYRSKQVEELRAKGCTNAWQVIRHKAEPKYDYKVYKSRIDKTIEYLRENELKPVYLDCKLYETSAYNDLLEILKGVDR